MIAIQEGHFLWAHRPLARAAERLERIPWISMPPPGVVSTTKTWEELVRRVIALNSDHYRQLVQHLKTDRLELFFRTFFWTNVELTPRPYEMELPDPVALGFYTPKKLESLLAEARKRVEEWPKIQARIGSGKRIFLSHVNLSGILTKKPDVIDQALEVFEEVDGRSSSSPHLPFSAEEIEIIHGCDGQNTVQDLVRQSLDGEFLTLRRLIHLWDKGTIYPKDEDLNATTLPQLSTRGTWKDCLGALGILVMVLGLLYSLHFLKPVGFDLPDSHYLRLQLNLYRAKNNQYPLSLLDLVNRKIISPDIAAQWNYRLIHPERYELTPARLALESP